jgi:intraflagellar transport protein 80
VELAINQIGALSDRRIAFVDKNGDLFLASVKSTTPGSSITKLGAMIGNGIRFHDTTNMLTALSDTRLLLYAFPSCVYADAQLLPKTIIAKELR